MRKPKFHVKRVHKFKFKHKNRHKKLRRMYSSLDRLFNTRLRALRAVSHPTSKLVNRRLASRTLRFIGSERQQVVRRSVTLIRKESVKSVSNKNLFVTHVSSLLPATQQKKHHISQKYRLKLAPLLAVSISPGVSRFSPQPERAVKRAYRVNRNLRMSSRTGTRAHKFSRDLLKKKQQLLRARRFSSERSRPKARTPYNKKGFEHKCLQKKLSLRLRLRLRRKISRPRQHASLLRKTRLQWLKHRAFRSARGTIVLSYFRRYWRGSKLIRRRRRESGRRLFAGIFGHRRWRLERRDKLTVKRVCRRFPLKRTVLYRTVAARNTLHTIVSALRKTSRSASRILQHFAQKTLILNSVAYLRQSLRRLVATRKHHKLTHFKGGHTIRRSAKRLDVRLRSALPHRRSARRVFRGNVDQKQLFARNILQPSIHRKTRVFLPKLSGRKYAIWTSSSLLQKLSMQKALRGATLSGSAKQLPIKAGVHAGLRALLAARIREKTVLIADNTTKMLRNARITSKLLTASAVRTPETKLPSSAPTTLKRRTIVRGLTAKKWTPKKFANFLNKLSASKTDQMSVFTATKAKTALLLSIRARRYKELRFYHRRPGLRLPNVTVTRRRRRKAGHVTFVQNSLKRPRTRKGQQNVLLPPVLSYTSARTGYSANTTGVFSALSAKMQHKDAWPRFWRRPHTRANIKAINRLRRRRYLKEKRAYLHNRKKKLNERKTPLLSAIAAPLLASAGVNQDISQQGAFASLQNYSNTFSAFSTSNSRKTSAPRVLRIVKRRKGKKSQVTCRASANATAPTRTARHLSPVLSRTFEATTLSRANKGPLGNRNAGLWQVRSVRRMLENERALSAWSPQMSVRNRRAHYPRVNATPTVRRWLSFKAKRDRRNFNAKLLARNIPQRRYIDYAPIKLQYYYGSISSSGYSRLRRIYRPHSKHNRWWRPNKVAAPFAHPYSRRALNATHYRRAGLARAQAPRYKNFTRVMRDARGISLHSKFPPRTIPWRNFRYPRPRRGSTPRTLNRWTFTLIGGKTGRSAPVRQRLTVKRSARELRQLARYTPSRNVWKNRRWALLDAVTKERALAAQISATTCAVPTSVWSALQKHTGTPAVYASVQTALFAKLRAWLIKQFATSPEIAATSTKRAQAYFFNLVTSTLAAKRTRLSSVATANEQHSLVRADSFRLKASRRAVRFLHLRELPRLGNVALPHDVLSRENSSLYKRWLSGISGALKRSQGGYTPTSRSRYTKNVAIAFGRRRVRFPASGRRRKSYDSLLHAFAKKVGPARFRRATVLRFQRPTPNQTSDFRETLIASSALYGLGRRRKTAQALSHVSYFSSPWRELLRHQASAGSSSGRPLAQKRRFLALPMLTVFKEKQKAPLRFSLMQHPTHVIRAGVLRRALRRRREERAFIDLRQSALQRRLPKEQASRPWKLRRAAKRRRAAKAGPYSRFNLRRRAATPGQWTLSHLSAVGPRRENLHLASLIALLPSGENILVLKKVVRKDRRAFRGFVLPPSRPKRVRKLRRQQRDTRKRRRRSRRAKRSSRIAVLRNTKHWSEKKDRRFRGLAYNHRRLNFAKTFSKNLRKRYARRSNSFTAQTKGLLRGQGTGRATTLDYLASAHGRAESATTLLQPTSKNLLALTSLHRKWRIAKLSKKSKSAKLRYRLLKLRARRLRKNQFKALLRTKRNAATSSVQAELVSSINAISPVTALWFQKPVARIIKTQGAKEKDLLAEIAAKEERYKVTAQYAESVTAFIPELMNSLMSKRIEKKQVTYSTAQQLVRNIYWSLRVYLNVDPFDTRFFVRDKAAAARVRLFEDISDLSEAQKTEQPQRAVLRYRFQPGRLLLAPNTMRFRGDWLRAFFPAKHALYQENAEDYGKFLLKTNRIRRLRIGARGMDSWITTKHLSSHETRARQLLTLRYSRPRPRFDTLLQTTRRLPQIECAPVVGENSSRAPFFVRKFSTYAGRGLSLTARWIQRRKRFVALENGWRSVSPVTQITARNRALPHLVARGRSNYVAARRSAMSTDFLDARFTRTKSPRSRQYLLRSGEISAKINKTEKLSKLIAFRNIAAKRETKLISKKSVWTRSTRRAVSSTYGPTLTAMKHKLFGVRNTHLTRRAQSVLFSRARSAFTLLSNFEPETQRPVTRYRTSSFRTSSITYTRPRILSRNAIFGKSSYWELRYYSKKKNRLKAFKVASLRNTLRAPRNSVLKKVTLNNTTFSTVAFNKIRGERKFFRAGVGRHFIRTLDFARACALHTRFRRQAPFDTYRPRLWNKLTLRWMKKYRIGRYWLRDTSRWLRDPWLSEIVACDMTLRPDRFGGELRSRQQQVGEYVAEVDAEGQDIRRKDALKERHKYQKILPAVKDTELLRTDALLKRAPVSTKIVTRHRLGITKEARRKPVPSLRLANYEYRDVIREHKENKAKSAKQKQEEEEAQIKEYWARKAKKLPLERPRRLPLKHPANLWLPHIIWKEIQRRVRKFEWRESDEVFFRKGFRKAFQFYPNERRKAPWLEHLMYTRATYSTRLREFRRRQYPHEQKKFKWLQRVRKMLYPGRQAKYIKGRRWPQLRRYNQKLHYSLFNLRDRAAARRRFKRLSGRTRPAVSSFVSMSQGLTNRLDVTCLKLGFAPTIYWARIVSEFGLLRVNGVTLYDPAYRLKPADVIYPNWDTVARFQHYFKPQLKAREEYLRQNRDSTAFYPTNMEYHPGVRAIVYKHAPDESDLRRSSRIRPAYFRWFKLDSM
jgi:ribosomal protein S4